MALSEEVQDNLEKAFLLTEDVEVKRSSDNTKKLSQKSAHRQAKKQTTAQSKKAIKRHQPEKSSTAGQKKTSISGGVDEMKLDYSMAKQMKESNKRRVDEKVKSMIRIDGLKIFTSHSTQPF